VSARRRIVRRVLGISAAVALAATAVLALVVVPPDGGTDAFDRGTGQGDAYRLLFLHVPSAWLAYLAFFVTAAASVLWLVPRTRAIQWDLLAGASAELGVIFTGLTLALGSLWGKPIWGQWWAWDARLTTTAMLFFLYLGYLALRRVGGGPEQRATRSAIAALIAFVDVPIVHFSVSWWTTLHQDGSVFNQKMQIHIHDTSMQITLLLAVAAFTLLYAYLVLRRVELLAVEEDLAERELQHAIAQRIGASTTTPSTPAAPPVPSSPPSPRPAGVTG
jgi:heme exporter protein C